MREKPELGKSGKNCLYSPLAFKQTQALFPFCWLWAQEPCETQTTLKDVTLGIAASSRTKALGLQGSVLKSKPHRNCKNLKYSTCTQNQKGRNECHSMMEKQLLVTVLFINGINGKLLIQYSNPLEKAMSCTIQTHTYLVGFYKAT